MPVKNRDSEPVVHDNDSLPTLFIDGAFTNRRDDGLNYIKLVTGIPEYQAEQVRFMISDERLKAIIDLLCDALNYYPKQRINLKKKPSKKNSK